MLRRIRKLINKYENPWCDFMGYENPYLDPYDHHITDLAVTNDYAAYKRFPENKHVYDKLYVAQSQGLGCGRLEDLKNKANTVNYPIFIKPRYGHLSTGSRNCVKIKNADQLREYVDYPSMMWSDFIDGREGMTDFILVNGRIVWQLTYVYSEEQHGFTDAWKYVSPDTPAPEEAVAWVRENVKGHTGFVNIQYRMSSTGPKMIEVGLRPARAGMYIIAADVPALSKNIRNVHADHYWDSSLDQQITFKPFYVFKCFSKGPILYLWPHNVVNSIVNFYTDMPIREYYWEPISGEGMVFYQFMTQDPEQGMKAKKTMELLFAVTQLIVAIIIALLVVAFFRAPQKVFVISLVIFIIFCLTSLLNPLYVPLNLYHALRQKIFGASAVKTQEQYDKENM